MLSLMVVTGAAARGGSALDQWDDNGNGDGVVCG